MSNFCPHCGAAVSENNAKNCVACGKPLSDSSETTKNDSFNDSKEKLFNFAKNLKELSIKASEDLRSEETKAKLKDFANQAQSFASEKTKDLKEELNKINETQEATINEKDNHFSWIGLFWAILIPVVFFFASTFLPLIIISLVMPNFIMQILLILSSIFFILNLTSTFRIYFRKSSPLPFTKITAPITVQLFEKFGLFNVYKYSISKSKNLTNDKFIFYKPTLINLLILLFSIITYGFTTNYNENSKHKDQLIKSHRNEVAFNYCQYEGQNKAMQIPSIMATSGSAEMGYDAYILYTKEDAAWPQRLSISESEFISKRNSFLKSMKNISKDNALNMYNSGQLLKICQSYFNN